MKKLSSNKTLTPVLQLGHPENYLLEEMAFTPDGKIFISSCDKEIRCWDARNGRLIRTIKFSENERLLALRTLADEKVICILKHMDEEIHIKSWDIKNKEPIFELTLNNYPLYHDYWACFNNNGILVCIYYRDEVKEIIKGEEEFIICMDKIEIIDTKTGEKIRTFKKYAIRDIKFIPNTNLVSFTYMDKIRLFDINTGKLLDVLKLEHEIDSIAFDNKGKLIAVGVNGVVEVRNIETKELISILKVNLKQVQNICFSPYEKMIAVLDRNYEIKIWDIYTSSLIAVFKKCDTPITFNPTGDILVSSWCNTIQFWDIKSKKLLTTIEPSHNINIVKFNPQGHGFVTLQGEDFISVWDLKNSNIVKIYDNDISMLEFSPDGKFIATVKNNKKINLWNAETGKLVETFSFGILKEEICFISFELNNKILVFASDRIIIFWDIRTGKWIKFLDESNNNYTFIHFKNKPHCRKIIKREMCITSPVIFSPHGDLFIFGSKETIQIWDFKKNMCSKILKGHGSDVFFVKFIFNGKILLSASKDGTINCWDIKTGELLKELKTSLYGNLRLISCFQNGKIFTLNKNNEIDVWDVEKENIVCTFKGEFHREMCLSCSENGKFLLIGNIDGSIELWEVETGKLKATFISFPDAWIVTTPDGYFSGKGNLEKYLHLIDEQNWIYDVGQFKDEFYVPTLLNSLLEQ